MSCSEPNDRCAAAVCLMAASVFVGITLVAVAGWLEGMAGGEIVRMTLRTLALLGFLTVIGILVRALLIDDDQPSVEEWKWGMNDSDVMEESKDVVPDEKEEREHHHQ